MITWGARYLLTLSGLSYLAACAYGLATGGGIVGVLSVGYKQGVGDHFGYGIAIGSTIALLGLTVVSLCTREGMRIDSEGLHTPVADMPRSSRSFVSPIAALAVALILAGIAFSVVFIVAGLILGFVVGIQWALEAWADGVSDDPSVNSVVRSKISSVIDVPVGALLLSGFIVVGVSRILLAVPAAYSTAIASVVAALVFGAAVFIAKANPSKKVISGLMAFGAVAVLVGGIVAAGVGEREHDHHSETAGHSEGDS